MISEGKGDRGISHSKQQQQQQQQQRQQQNMRYIIDSKWQSSDTMILL